MNEISLLTIKFPESVGKFYSYGYKELFWLTHQIIKTKNHLFLFCMVLVLLI